MTDISMRTYDNRYRGNEADGSLAIGGMMLVGIGVGFTYLPESPLLFVASILTGLGVGLMIASAMSKRA